MMRLEKEVPRTVGITVLENSLTVLMDIFHSTPLTHGKQIKLLVTIKDYNLVIITNICINRMTGMLGREVGIQ